MSRIQKGSCLAGYLYKFFGWDRAPYGSRCGVSIPENGIFLAPPPGEANAARDNGLVFSVLMNAQSGFEAREAGG
jgi:hypothetical protein